MKNLIYVVTHKKVSVPNYSPYKPIIVGFNNVMMDGAWRDNVGDNISKKNGMYCELTAMYWIWKNKSNDYDTFGLNHYRRFFTKSWCNNKKILTNEDIDRDFKKYDIILPKPFYWKNTVKEMYCGFGEGPGHEKDLNTCVRAVEELYPGYSKTMKNVLQRRYACYCNMFIMRKKDYINYCEWLFNILEYVEKNTDLTGYSVQELRIFGYLSEILLNVWVENNGLKAKYYNIAFAELTKKEQIYKVIRNKVTQFLGK